MFRWSRSTDADFNCGVNDGRTSVEEYADVTRGAHGAVDFWGNVWEWTSTVRTDDGEITELGVKGGSWKSARTDCRTEHRKESRAATGVYEDVGFRVIKVLNGEEPEQKVELATLNAPVVTAKTVSTGKIVLSWQTVNEAVEYQIFEYCENTALFRMLNRTAETAFAVETPNDGNSYSYVVLPISYTAICDNVSTDFAVKPKEVLEPTEISEKSDGEKFFRDNIRGGNRHNNRRNSDKKKALKPRLVTKRKAAFK